MNSHRLMHSQMLVTLACMVGNLENIVDERELWQRVLSGEMEAYHRLYDRYASDIASFLKARCRGRIDAEALCQEVWMKVWEKRATFDGQHLRGWLFQIARNLWKDCLKSADQRYGRQFDEHLDLPTHSELRTENDQLSALRDCLNELGGDFVSVLRYRLDGKDDSEIADLMGISIGAVYSRASRGRDQVSTCVEQKLD